MYLTPSIIDGILRASIAFIVHPTDGDAQITTLYYYTLFTVGFFIPLPHEYNKRNALFQVLLGKISPVTENSFVSA